eukprot:NODE_167_length_14562_cov_0.357256.p2 type:complete len:355 gc:universal NODE_167_length_14562_cov_0.357256:7481-8545(+)
MNFNSCKTKKGSNMYFMLPLLFAFVFKFTKSLSQSVNNEYVASGICTLDTGISINCIRKSTRWPSTSNHCKNHKSKSCPAPLQQDIQQHMQKYAKHLKFLMGFQNKHIITIYHVSESYTPQTSYKTLLVDQGKVRKLTRDVSFIDIYMEQCLGDLQQLHGTKNNRMKYSDVEIMMVDILNALKALHANSLYHLDIKPENIVKCQYGDEIVYKLINFGQLTDVETVDEYHGTLEYAPKQINQRFVSKNNEPFSFNATRWDIISLAKTVYAMTYLEEPLVTVYAMTYLEEPLVTIELLCFSLDLDRRIPFDFMFNENIFTNNQYVKFITFMDNAMNCNLNRIKSAENLLKEIHKLK